MALGFLYFCSLIWVNPGLACEINADPLVQKDTLLAGQPFWSSPAVDIGACAKACMRLKICSSFNYVLNSTLCELSSDTAENRTGLVSNVTGCVYSDIMDWPATVSNVFFIHLHSRNIYNRK